MYDFSLRKTVFPLLAALIFLSSMAGCSSIAKTWDKTVNTSEGMYKKYLNPDPCVDLDQDSGCSNDEVKLATLFIPVDEHLAGLIKRQDDKDTFPDSSWAEQLLADFPWLNGIAIMNTDGEVLLKRPATPIKEANTAFIMSRDWDFSVRGVRWVIEETPLGPEFYVVGPFYKDNEVQGMSVSHFDPRSLVRLSPDPEELVVFSAQTMIWAGQYGSLGSEILDFNWEDMLDDDVQGSFEVQGKEFLWLARYVGLEPIVYAVERVPEKD